MTTNLERMIQLADEFFATKNDPNQISVTEKDRDKLLQIHSATMCEQNDGDGPIAWVLIIPTSHDIMLQFIAKNINEQELLERTPLQTTYDSIYLCSALVLSEHRGKGFAKRLACDAIRSIQINHPIKNLFFWAFSDEGEKLAAAIAESSNLPLDKRPA